MLPGRHHVNAMSVNDAGNFNDPASFLVATEASCQCVAVSSLQELLSFLYFSLLASMLRRAMRQNMAKHGKTRWNLPEACTATASPHFCHGNQRRRTNCNPGKAGKVQCHKSGSSAEWNDPPRNRRPPVWVFLLQHRHQLYPFSWLPGRASFQGTVGTSNSEDSWNVSCMRTTGSTHELNQVNPRPPCTFHTPTAGLGEALCSRRKPLGLCGTFWRSSVTWSKRLRRQPNSAGVVWNMTPSSDASDLSSFSFYPVRQWWQVQPVQYFPTLIVFLTLIQSFQGGGPSQDQPPLSAFHLQMDPELVQLDQCQKKTSQNRRKNYEKSPAHLERFDAPDSPWPTLRR